RNLARTKPSALPRMADFAILAAACETCCWPPGSFLTAYNANRADAADGLLEADPVASAVRMLAVKRRRWTGTATALDGIWRTRRGDGVNEGRWPAEPRLVRVRLNERDASLAKVGVSVTFTKTPDRSRTRRVTIMATISRQVPTGSADNSAHPPASAASEI